MLTLVILLVGFAVGYGVRAEMSRRRRERARRRQYEMGELFWR